MECTGAQILLESLKKEGVDVLFGYPGGAVIDIYDELPRHPDIRHVHVRHEQGAVHAGRRGYARASGKVGACLVTSARAPPTRLRHSHGQFRFHSAGGDHGSGAHQTGSAMTPFRKWILSAFHPPVPQA